VTSDIIMHDRVSIGRVSTWPEPNSWLPWSLAESR